MSERFALRIGPVCVALHGEMDPSRWTLDAGHHKFFSPTHLAQTALHVERRRSAACTGQLAFEAGRVARFYRDSHRWCICLGEDEHSLTMDRVLSLDASGVTGSLLMNPGSAADPAARYPLEYPLEE